MHSVKIQKMLSFAIMRILVFLELRMHRASDALHLINFGIFRAAYGLNFTV